MQCSFVVLQVGKDLIDQLERESHLEPEFVRGWWTRPDPEVTWQLNWGGAVGGFARSLVLPIEPRIRYS